MPALTFLGHGAFTLDLSGGRLRPELSIPMHYNTFEIIMADPDCFVRKAAQAGLKARVLAVGETLSI